jgi:endonuclease IV
VETILNIYLLIDNGLVTSFKSISYEMDGTDEVKIDYLKTRAKEDYSKAITFNAPQNKNNKFMSYNKFHKLEKNGMQYRLFEEIFEKFNAPQNPIVCVTPVVDGEVWSK